MADATADYTVKNTDKGPRGFWTGPDGQTITYVEPDQTLIVSMTADEAKALGDLHYFEVGKATAADKKAAAADSDQADAQQ